MKRLIKVLFFAVAILSFDAVDSKKEGYVDIRAHLDNGKTCVVRVKEEKLLARDNYKNFIKRLMVRIKAKCAPGESI